MKEILPGLLPPPKAEFNIFVWLKNDLSIAYGSAAVPLCAVTTSIHMYVCNIMCACFRKRQATARHKSHCGGRGEGGVNGLPAYQREVSLSLSFPVCCSWIFSSGEREEEMEEGKIGGGATIFKRQEEKNLHRKEFSGVNPYSNSWIFRMGFSSGDCSHLKPALLLYSSEWGWGRWMTGGGGLEGGLRCGSWLARTGISENFWGKMPISVK